jgi:hypothetical protein
MNVIGMEVLTVSFDKVGPGSVVSWLLLAQVNFSCCMLGYLVFMLVIVFGK